MTSGTLERDVYRLPLYTPPQAARIVAVPAATLRNWAQGYSYKTLQGAVEAFPLITTTRVGNSRAPVTAVPRPCRGIRARCVPGGWGADATNSSGHPLAR